MRLNRAAVPGEDAPAELARLWSDSGPSRVDFGLLGADSGLGVGGCVVSCDIGPEWQPRACGVNFKLDGLLKNPCLK